MMSRDRFRDLSIKSQVCSASMVFLQAFGHQKNSLISVLLWPQMFNEQSLEFQEKIMQRSGLGDETYLPEGM